MLFLLLEITYPYPYEIFFYEIFFLGFIRSVWIPSGQPSKIVQKPTFETGLDDTCDKILEQEWH